MNETITNGYSSTHGSLERVSGKVFRAIAGNYLSGHPEISVKALIHLLRSHLENTGVKYHPRTIKRQLSGTVETVPPEMEKVMRDMILESGDAGIDLCEAGEGGNLSEYILFERFIPLLNLWLHFNPGRSKRYLAAQLQKDLESIHILLKLNSLEDLLTGKRRVVRREAFELLLKYLDSHDIHSEADAIQKMREISPEVEHSLQNRDFINPRRFYALCRVWQIHHHEASSRKMALLLRERLQGRDVSISLDHLQSVVNGKTRLVRQVIQDVMEEMARESLLQGSDLEEEIAKIEKKGLKVEYLCWVNAEPIADMARKWIAEHPHSSMRQLALRVASTIRHMGYTKSYNAIQPVLGGWKKKTRGFVYQAMLRQFEAPETFSPSSASFRHAHRSESCSEELKRGLEDLRRYMPHARSQYFLPFSLFWLRKKYRLTRNDLDHFLKKNGFGAILPSSTFEKDEWEEGDETIFEPSSLDFSFR